MNQEFLRECFTYEPKTGHLKWKDRPLTHFRNPSDRKFFRSNYLGKTVTGKTVSINGIPYSTASIIWLMHHGGTYLS